MASKTSTKTATEVRSPTSTKTATDAYTQGNFTATVTGGAGSGDTHVHIDSAALPATKDSRKGKGAGDDLDLMAAFGDTAPEGASSMLDSEDPAVVADIMDAVDDQLDQTARAEAFFRAIKGYMGAAAAPPAVDLGMVPDSEY